MSQFAVRDNTFTRLLANKLAVAGLRRARPGIFQASKTLARAARAVVVNDNEAWIYIPHYWALMVHDGRLPFSKDRIMVWFRDPRDDPRLVNGQTPERVSQLRSLSKQEFAYWSARNRLADPTGLNPEKRPMVVTKVIRKGTPARPFFSNKEGMAGFSREARLRAGQEWSAFLAAEVPGVGRVEADVVVVRL